jgi:hypothetical protein
VAVSRFSHQREISAVTNSDLRAHPTRMASSPVAPSSTAACSTSPTAATSKRATEEEIDPAASKRPRLHDYTEDRSADALAPDATVYPTISFHCLQRAQKTIHDVIQSYLFIFHVPDDVQGDTKTVAKTAVVSTHPSPSSLTLMFRLLPLLTYVSGTIYQMDEENERWSERRREEVDRGEETGRSSDGDTTELANSDDDATSSTAFTTLLSVLRSQHLLTPRIHTELQRGRVYWQLEREICEQLAQGRRPNVNEVHAASRSKSFDYRVLHLLIYGFLRTEPNDAMLTALSWNEQLVDLHDDLVDYEEDISSNSFNLYRCYVAMYGGDQAQLKVMERIRSMEETFEKCMEALPPSLHLARARFRLRESEAMVSSGSGRADQDASRWVLPAAIENEREWREECRRAEEGHVRMRVDEEEEERGSIAMAASTAAGVAVARTNSLA